MGYVSFREGKNRRYCEVAIELAYFENLSQIDSLSLSHIRLIGQ